jgi:hypothetical protein
MMAKMRPERRKVFCTKLEDRSWVALDKDKTSWEHPRLAYPWPFGDALRLEGEVDSQNEQARELLGFKLKGISE